MSKRGIEMQERIPVDPYPARAKRQRFARRTGCRNWLWKVALPQTAPSKSGWFAKPFLAH